MVPDPKEDRSDRDAADITTLLAAMSGGDGAAVAEIWTRLHEEFRVQAHGMLARGGGESLQLTELIGMAFQRIQRLHGKPWTNRAHFQAVVALSMHSALVDRARARARRVTVVTGSVDEILVEVESRVGDLAQFEDALLRFEAVDPVMAKALRLRCLGYSQDEVATMLDLSRRSLDRSFARARAYVHRLLA